MALLSFYGAVEGVTGSCYLLETGSTRLLLDCGLYQGGREAEAANKQAFPFDMQSLDAVVLSHAHLDHSGRLPLLVAQGYSGPIYMTSPTCDLILVLLKDAASLQQRDAEWENKHRRRAGEPEQQPLFTLEDVEQTMDCCLGAVYGKRFPVADNVDIRFLEAGHILGSAIVELYVREDGREKKLVFSGDLGNSQAALLRDPSRVSEADVVLLESTYGDREHRSMDATLEEFETIVAGASKSGGNVLIPSFAVGRTQEIIFRLGELYQKGLLRQQAVFLDSPMAIAVTEIYHRYQDVFNLEDRALIQGQHKHRSLHNLLPNLYYAVSTEDSMALNRLEKGAIIIAGSGMCNGGRIRHHFRHNLWRKEAHVVFVGYQAIGTPGRALVDGAKTFRVGGEDIAVRAQIHTVGGFSAHAGQSQLVEWLRGFTDPRPRLLLVHGEDEAKRALQQAVAREGWDADIPTLGQTIEF